MNQMNAPAPLLRSHLPLPLVHVGKVREMYDAGEGRLLMVASDRVSAFDVVMAEPVPRKGEVLTLLTSWWLRQVEAVGIAHHALTADPDEITAILPELEESRSQWARRSLLVRRTSPLPVECVVRGYLAGSAWREYRDSGTLAGEVLPGGLVESQRLEPPLFSPATKAKEGHDENIPFVQVADLLGAERAAELRRLSLQLYEMGAEVARSRGILLADTKFEFGETDEDGLVLIDEVLTPDSSRYWPRQDYAPGSAPPSLDKQPVRDYLDSLSAWDRTPPPPALPPPVVEATTRRYLEIFQRLTGQSLNEYSPPTFLPGPAD